MTAVVRQREVVGGAVLATGLCVWFLGALFLGFRGVFQQDALGVPLTLLLGITLPIAGFAAALGVHSGFRAWVERIDIRPLVLLHTWRMLGLGFVFLAAYGVLSPTFALPAGLGDAAAAIGAFWLGVALYRGRATLRAIYAWSALGLLDFTLAIALGVLARPGVGVLPGPATTAPMGELPLALIPGFVVPFLVITHWIILRNARRQLAGHGASCEAPRDESASL